MISQKVIATKMWVLVLMYVVPSMNWPGIRRIAAEAVAHRPPRVVCSAYRGCGMSPAWYNR